MATIVKIKGKRYVGVNLQTQGTKRFNFGEIKKQGSLDGYVTGVVDTAYDVFQHPLYGKLRKLILKDNENEDEDIEQHSTLSFFTRGKVAEKCSVIKKGEMILIENPFVEFTNVQEKRVYHLAGDKDLSDICVWIVSKNSTLLVGKEEDSEKEQSELPEDSVADSENGSTTDDEQSSPSILHSKRRLRSSHQQNRLEVSDKDVQKSETVRHSPRIKNNNTSKIQKPITSPAPKSPTKQASNVSKTIGSKETNEINENIEEEYSYPLRSHKSSRLEMPNGTAKNTTENCGRSKGMQESSSQSTYASIRRHKSKETTKVITRASNDTNEDDEDTEDENSNRLSSRVEVSKDIVNTPERSITITESPMVLRNRNNHQINNEETLSSKKKSPKNPNQKSQKKSIIVDSSHLNTRILRSHASSSSSVTSSQLKRKPKMSNKLNRIENASSKRKPQSSSSEEEITEFGSSETDGEISSPVIKRRRSKEIGSKETITQANQPKFMNAVVVLSTPIKHLTKENQNCHLNHSPTKSTTSESNINVESSQSSSPRLRSHASSNVASADIEKSCESNENDSQTSAQPTTPSGVFQCTRKKLSKNKDSTSLPATPKKTTAPKPTMPATPSGTITNNVPCTPGSDMQQESRNAQASTSGTSATNNPEATDNTHKSPRDPSAIDNQPKASTSTQVVADTSPNSNIHSRVEAARDSYHLPTNYTKISDVQINAVVNLYGVVRYFKPPWKSKGTDMCSVVVLADPSTDETLECVMFKDAVFLPQVRRIGDIVRLHRMNIKKYKDKLQALSTRGFSAIVFDRNVDIPVSEEAARFGTGSFSFENADKDIVKTLKEWRISQTDLFEPAKFLTVSEIEPEQYFDIICLVQGLQKQTNLDCVCLKVTDGTNPKHEIKSCDEDSSYEEVLKFDPSQCSFQTFDVTLYGDHALLLMNLKVSIGSILLLHNVHSVIVEGGPGASLLDMMEPTLELCLHRGSEYGRGLVVLNKESSDAKGLLERLK